MHVWYVWILIVIMSIIMWALLIEWVIAYKYWWVWLIAWAIDGVCLWLLDKRNE